MKENNGYRLYISSAAKTEVLGQDFNFKLKLLALNF